MANPLRFFGTGEPELVDEIIIPPRCSIEVTVRTHGQEFLLRPDPTTTEIIRGCFARAYDRYPELNLHALDARSNHVTYFATPETPLVLSGFMRDFLSTTAVRMNEYRRRSGTFWERRYRAIPAIDEPSVEKRFRYVLTQGTKENLVMSARDWPGLSSIETLTTGEPMIGRWRDKSAEYEKRRQWRRKHERAAKRGKILDIEEPGEIWTEYTIKHVPLPHWSHLDPHAIQERVAAIICDDDQVTKKRHERDGTRPLGVTAILEVDPFDSPDEPKKSPAPLCHASSKQGRRAYRKLYRAFADSIRHSVGILRKGLPAAGFPAGSITQPLAHPSNDNAHLDDVEARAPTSSNDNPATGRSTGAGEISPTGPPLPPAA